MVTYDQLTEDQQAYLRILKENGYTLIQPAQKLSQYPAIAYNIKYGGMAIPVFIDFKIGYNERINLNEYIFDWSTVSMWTPVFVNGEKAYFIKYMPSEKKPYLVANHFFFDEVDTPIIRFVDNIQMATKEDLNRTEEEFFKKLNIDLTELKENY